MPSPLVIKVNETPTSFIKGGGLKGYVLDQQVVSWDNVLASASRKLDEVGTVPNFIRGGLSPILILEGGRFCPYRGNDYNTWIFLSCPRHYKSGIDHRLLAHTPEWLFSPRL